MRIVSVAQAATVRTKDISADIKQKSAVVGRGDEAAHLLRFLFWLKSFTLAVCHVILFVQRVVQRFGQH